MGKADSSWSPALGIGAREDFAEEIVSSLRLK